MSLGPGLTVVHGRNGAGKTNLLEAVYLGCTGRSFRTASDRETIRFGAQLARVELHGEDEAGSHSIVVGLAPGQPKQLRVDGSPVERLVDAAARPLAAVFAPDRLELVKGGPGLRRAHLDQFVAALWPARASTRRDYAQALAQRNALLGRVRMGAAGRETLDAWDARLAEVGVELMGDRRAAVARLTPAFEGTAQALGLDGSASLQYRPRSSATTGGELASELRDRIDRDLERGFTGHGPHRDDLTFTREARELRSYGSQGQQRLAVLALLLAEREAIAEVRGAAPLILLDDAMSELDAGRRERLVERLSAVGGQAVVTTTDVDHVPGAAAPSTVRVAVADGAVLEAAQRSAA